MLMGARKEVLIGQDHKCTGKSEEERAQCRYYEPESESGECLYYQKGECLYPDSERYV